MRYTQQIASILEEVAQRHEVTVEEITGKGTRREFMEPRVDAARKLYQLGLTQREIATILHRDQGGVAHYLNRRDRWTP